MRTSPNDASNGVGALRRVALRPSFYATSRNDLIEEFYIPCLEMASSYDRAVGYFRSSILAIAGVPFSNFAQRGGRARFLCSPELSETDARAIADGYARRDVSSEALERELEQVLKHPHGEEVVRLLATLVAIGCLDLRVAIKQGGIFHHKIGIFSDAKGDAISFLGSTNEGWNGWSPAGNDESFDVFISWGADNDRVQRHQEFFESAWRGDEVGVEIFDLPTAFRSHLLQFRHPEDEFNVPAHVFLQPPKRVTLYPHQEQALADWLRNGYRGLLEHATGSGKTITALEAVRQWLAEGRPAVILVPSDLLLTQWKAEARRYFGSEDPPTLYAGGPFPRSKWEPNLPAFTHPDGGPRLVISTLQSAATMPFLSRIPDASQLLVVVDEAHRAGSPVLKGVFGIDARARLGLSATPRRFNDPEGTAAIMAYFQRILIPRFTLRDAIREGLLCPYTYYVHDVVLTHDEQDAWVKATHEIAVEVARSSEEGPHAGLPETERLKQLFIKRARIVKKAAGKVATVTQILNDHYEDGQAWIVYCEDQIQLGEVLDALRHIGLPAYEYHSAMHSDRPAAMSYFVQEGGIVVAIRCLDEGVDIPRVSHAVILASSRNQREFVQRRGRVLRKYPGKFIATIHDAIVLPDPASSADQDAQLVGPELARAIVFAQDARNRATYVDLIERAGRLGLSMTAAEEGEEDDV